MKNPILKGIIESQFNIHKLFEFVDAEDSNELAQKNKAEQKSSFTINLEDIDYQVDLTLKASTGLYISFSSDIFNYDCDILIQSCHQDKDESVSIDWTPDFSNVKTSNITAKEKNQRFRSFSALTNAILDMEMKMLSDESLGDSLRQNARMYHHEYEQRLGDLKSEECERLYKERLSKFNENYAFLFNDKDESLSKAVRDLVIKGQPGETRFKRFKVIQPTLDLDSITEVELRYEPLSGRYSAHIVVGNSFLPLEGNNKTSNPNVAKDWIRYAITEK